MADLNCKITPECHIRMVSENPTEFIGPTPTGIRGKTADTSHCSAPFSPLNAAQGYFVACDFNVLLMTQWIEGEKTLANTQRQNPRIQCARS